MDHYRRYALYYTPPQGEFADFGAAWLGWDAGRGVAVAQPVLPGLDIAALTAAPRKYGFHATLKPPFRLADGTSAADLAQATAQVAARLAQLERGDGWILFGKTGWADTYDPDIGWWVGWVQKGDRVYAFAMNVDMPNEGDAKKRIALGKECLKILGVLP